MQFVNPIEILKLSNVTEGSSIDSDIIKKAKRRLFADIDLSDGQSFNYYGISLNKQDCDRAIEELYDIEKKEFYIYLTTNKSLNNFLINGDNKMFNSFKQDSIFKIPEFINFISPYFVVYYSKALYKAFESSKIEELRLVLNTSLLVASNDINISYKDVSNEINNRIDKVNNIQEKIDIYTNSDIIEIVPLIKKYFPIDILNSLPFYFKSQILKIAKKINHLSLAIWENLDAPYVCKDLLEHVLRINVDSLEKPMFEKNYEIVLKKIRKKIEIEKNTPIIEKWAKILQDLNEIRVAVQQQKITTSAGYSKVNGLLRIYELNSIPSFGDEIRREIAFAIRSISVEMWNINNDITNAIHTINLAHSINLDDDATNRIRQDIFDLNELAKKYKGVLRCYFCEQSKPDANSSLEKIIYKETRRTYLPKRVEFSQIQVSLPRCKSCKEIHSEGNSQFSIYFILILGSGIGIGAITDGNHFILGGIIGAAIGWIVGNIFENKSISKNGIKDVSEITLSKHPLLEDKIKAGWSFSKPRA